MTERASKGVLGRFNDLWAKVSEGLTSEPQVGSPKTPDESETEDSSLQIIAFLSPSGKRTARSTPQWNDNSTRGQAQRGEMEQDDYKTKARQLLRPVRGERPEPDSEAVRIVPGTTFSSRKVMSGGPRPHNNLNKPLQITGNMPSKALNGQAFVTGASQKHLHVPQGRGQPPPKKRRLNRRVPQFASVFVNDSEDELAMPGDSSDSPVTRGRIDTATGESSDDATERSRFFGLQGRRSPVESKSNTNRPVKVSRSKNLIRPQDVLSKSFVDTEGLSHPSKAANSYLRSTMDEPPRDQNTIVHSKILQESPRQNQVAASDLEASTDANQFPVQAVLYSGKQYKNARLTILLLTIEEEPALALFGNGLELGVSVQIDHITRVQWANGSTAVRLCLPRQLDKSPNIFWIQFSHLHLVSTFSNAILPYIRCDIDQLDSEKYLKCKNLAWERSENVDVQNLLSGLLAEGQTWNLEPTSAGDNIKVADGAEVTQDVRGQAKGRDEILDKIQDVASNQSSGRGRQNNLFNNNNMHLRRSTRSSGGMVDTEITNSENFLGNIPEIPDSMKYSKVKGLGTMWRRSLFYPATGKNRATVDFDDLLRLDEGEFLNDNLVGFYIRFLQETLEEEKPKVAKSVYWFNTYFYTTLVSGHRRNINFEAVRKWTRGVNLFSYDYIVVPINENLHWYLALICNLPTLDRRLSPLAEPSAADADNAPSRPDGSSEIGSSDEHSLAKGCSQCRETTRADMSPLTNPEPRDLHTTEFGNRDDRLDLQRASESRTNPPEQLKTRGDSNEGTVKVEMQQRHSSFNEEKVQLGRESASPHNSRRQRSSLLVKNKRKILRRPRTYDADQPAIVTLDSLPRSMHPQVCQQLRQYLAAEAADKRGDMSIDSKDIQGVTAVGLPLQSNWSDCGLYLLGYLDKFVEDPTKFVTGLLHKNLDPQQDWPKLNPSQMRHGLRDLIFEKHDESEGVRKAAKKEKRRSLSQLASQESQRIEEAPSAVADQTRESQARRSLGPRSSESANTGPGLIEELSSARMDVRSFSPIDRHAGVTGTQTRNSTSPKVSNQLSSSAPATNDVLEIPQREITTAPNVSIDREEAEGKDLTMLLDPVSPSGSPPRDPNISVLIDHADTTNERAMDESVSEFFKRNAGPSFEQLDKLEEDRDLRVSPASLARPATRGKVNVSRQTYSKRSEKRHKERRTQVERSGPDVIELID